MAELVPCSVSMGTLKIPMAADCANVIRRPSSARLEMMSNTRAGTRKSVASSTSPVPKVSVILPMNVAAVALAGPSIVRTRPTP